LVSPLSDARFTAISGLANRYYLFSGVLSGILKPAMVRSYWYPVKGVIIPTNANEYPSVSRKVHNQRYYVSLSEGFFAISFLLGGKGDEKKTCLPHCFSG
jgi:hypothetical protein